MWTQWINANLRILITCYGLLNSVVLVHLFIDPICHGMGRGQISQIPPIITGQGMVAGVPLMEQW